MLQRQRVWRRIGLPGVVQRAIRSAVTSLRSSVGLFRWWLLLLPTLAVASCGNDSKKASPNPIVTVEAGGAGGAEQPGEGQAEPFPEGGAPAVPKPPCNGWPDLCARRYDEVSFPVAHAAMANSPTFWRYPAQDRGLRAQLDDSIRGLMLEVRDKGGAPTLCFADCAEGHAALVPELSRVAGFLGDNPREVVTLFIDNHVPAADIASAVDTAKLAPFLYQGDPGQPWPTLGELIEQGQRLVIFLSDAIDAPAGYLSLPEQVRATSGDAQATTDLDCSIVSGSVDAPLTLLMQTLVAPLADGSGGAPAVNVGRPSAEVSQTVNHDPFFSQRVALCSDEYGRAPNFVAVDFYEQSDVIGVTQRVNGLLP